MKTMTTLLVATVLGAALPAVAQTPNPHAAHAAPAAAQSPASSVLYDGVVKRVNAETKRVTLSHGPLKEFQMDGMTMAFPVEDAKLLAGLKEGDKVRFGLKAVGDNLVVTRIERAK